MSLTVLRVAGEPATAPLGTFTAAAGVAAFGGDGDHRPPLAHTGNLLLR